ncbi:MAG TPA: CDP-alcohol phosphatidyltransferase family protein, partial [Nocardioidaceae bacterium]|nr:CDP-alcohol phosphatidyltransferase family protein [Nocardioidaceae bacterium]
MPGGRAWSVLAPLLLWAALVAPHRPEELTPLALLRLPVEGLALLAVLLVLPGRPRRWAGLLAGLGLAGLCLYKLVDLGFRLALDRPFDPVTDATYADSTVSLLFDSVGAAGAVLVLVGVVVLVVGLLVGLPLAGLRAAALLEGRRGAAGRVLACALAVWLALAATGLTLGAGRVASTGDVALAVQQWQQVRDGIRDERSFDRLLAQRSATTGQPRLAGLRGKDVLLVFVESYGRFAVEGPSAGPVTALLDRGTRRLSASGYAARSGFLTSPTFGGMSWLAHATFQSGLWIDSQRRYDRLVEEGHPTLTGAFEQAGWRTVVDIPSSDPPWPEGQRLYGFDVMYGRRSMGYGGPGFGYGKVPDQFTLEALHR